MTAKPHYLESERLDDLSRMVTELTSEVWVLRDRLTVMESLLDEHGVLPRTEIDTHVPQSDLTTELEREREALIGRVLGAPHQGDYTVASLVAKGHR